MKDVECPYCGHEIEVCHDDGFGYEEDTLHEYQCPKCEKYFVFTTSISIHHTSYPADCLNGAPHKYKKTITFPNVCARLRCEDCGHEKPIDAKDEI